MGRSTGGQRAPEVLEVHLPAGAVEVQPLAREAALLDDQPRTVALSGEPGLEMRLLVGAGLGPEMEVVGGLAGLDPGPGRSRCS